MTSCCEYACVRVSVEYWNPGPPGGQGSPSELIWTGVILLMAPLSSGATAYFTGALERQAGVGTGAQWHGHVLHAGGLGVDPQDKENKKTSCQRVCRQHLLR